MAVPNEIARLVELFEQNRDSYLKGRYNEAQLRQEFINPFFTILYWNFTYTCVVLLHALLEAPKKTSESFGILTFRTRLLHIWLPKHERGTLQSRPRSARFSKKAKEIERRATAMRHKVIAHRDPSVAFGSDKVAGLTIGDLRALYSETEALFAACCFETEYVTTLYPGGTVEGRRVDKDIERLMKLLLRDSEWLMQPERDGRLWPETRKLMSQADLDELNDWRVKVGLSEA